MHTIQYRLAKGTATAPYDTEYNTHKYKTCLQTQQILSPQPQN